MQQRDEQRQMKLEQDKLREQLKADRQEMRRRMEQKRKTKELNSRRNEVVQVVSL
jgi:hypothetical protein